jgi:hypothetical protein
MAICSARATSSETQEWTRLLLEAARTLAGAPEDLMSAITVVMPAPNPEGEARLELERLAEHVAGEYRLDAQTIESARSLVVRITRPARSEKLRAAHRRQGHPALRVLWRRIVSSKREDVL